jgi:putative transposase
MAISFKGAHFPHEIILMGVRRYMAYPLSTRHVEDLMLERVVHVDHLLLRAISMICSLTCGKRSLYAGFSTKERRDRM